MENGRLVSAGPEGNAVGAIDNRDPVPGLANGQTALSFILSKVGYLDLTGCELEREGIMRGHGGYSDVFVGRVPLENLHHRRPMGADNGKVKVAIKRLRVHIEKDISLAKALAREMGVWAKLDHPNILPLLGYIFENDYPSLVSEWVSNGTVLDFVKKNPECDIIHLALGIAKGLQYLHDRNIIHSDLKPDNVLISKDGEPLICDFGMSRMLFESQSNFVSTTHGHNPRGTTRYMAIELLDDEGKHSMESDVWAYGMALYEIIFQQMPYAQLNSDGKVVLAIVRGELPRFPNNCMPALQSICTSCWAKAPEKRLRMAQIAYLLSTPLHEQMWRVTGFVAEQKGDLDQALAAYEQGLQYNPNSAPILKVVAEVAKKKSDYAKAIDYFQRVLHLQQDNGEAWISLGDCYTTQDDFQNAYSAYHQALHYLPEPEKNLKLWYGIGILCDRYGSLECAEKVFIAILHMNKAFIFDVINDVRFRLGMVYKKKGKHKEALRNFELSLHDRESPPCQDLAETWFQLGHVQELGNNEIGAIESYSSSIMENLEPARALHSLVRVSRSLHFSPAIKTVISRLTTSLECDLGNAERWYLLGLARVVNREHKKALELYQQAINLDSRNFVYWFSLGTVYSIMGECRNACEAYSQAIRINPSTPEAWFNLGSMYENCDQISYAIDAYTRATYLEPNDSIISGRLALLRQARETGREVMSLPPPPRDWYPQSHRKPRPEINIDLSLLINRLGIPSNGDDASTGEGSSDKGNAEDDEGNISMCTILDLESTEALLVRFLHPFNSIRIPTR